MAQTEGFIGDCGLPVCPIIQSDGVWPLKRFTMCNAVRQEGSTFWRVAYLLLHTVETNDLGISCVSLW